MIAQLQNIPPALPHPWHWDDTDLTRQLYREISESHVLFAKTLRTIARRQDNDDVLFQLENDDYLYAVVHLTWSQKTLQDPYYPRTELYKDWNDLYFDRILADCIEFEELKSSDD